MCVCACMSVRARAVQCSLVRTHRLWETSLVVTVGWAVLSRYSLRPKPLPDPEHAFPEVQPPRSVACSWVTGRRLSGPCGGRADTSQQRGDDTRTAPVPCGLRGLTGAGFRGWKEVTSLFNDDDEEHLLGRCKSPKSRGTSLRLKEELKTEKKSGFWDNLVLKPNTQSKKPDEIEGWEPPKLALEDVAAESGPLSD
ncbi:PREDICTED: testis development-related protein, partial [Myotis brandtii]|uniref:testis development-related protein n=1 Tax=Myotis brandtii TaxID=109478 RepID=UPI0003BBDB3D